MYKEVDFRYIRRPNNFLYTTIVDYDTYHVVYGSHSCKELGGDIEGAVMVFLECQFSFFLP